ncbi:hypothetical protein AAHH43_001363 [Pseudomonas aeruginosa]|uniref:hypothetical protein n=1 Tax=Pseudomonas aeruginosa TaxID=287 RepID=UPI001243B0BE|nr:hypothetical protein [Pseudomonas aeruginosa]KAB0740556.1 hypothetical protein F7O88_01740 [Pseudomonas aeruginosa]MBK3752865.1 hypothetical protein [Pseudomonas aeruginosa]MBK3763103.1 hypothetical protein [Pseudomonas aeruginosa]MBK3769643.1 hypothetical protein [Pseudomonas aeruginosa]MBK3789831.1 hypothetical protein [Pseudomonas aeruginosa]
MSIEVQSFDDFDSLQQIEAQQSNLIRVVLEGRDDVALFASQWFVAEQEMFDFVEAGHIVAGAGCTSVANAVEHSRNNDGVPAIGIVDRDVLFRERNWTVLYEQEQTRFEATTLNDRVHVASLWEIEAYLFDPDLLRNLVRACSRQPPATAEQMNAALDKTLAECALLLDIAPYLAGSHEAGTAVAAGYLCDANPQRVQAEVAQKLAALAPPGAAAAVQVQALIEQVKAVLPGAPAEQLPFYLRYVDTKRLLQRLTHALGLTANIKWVLAALQEASSRRPHELAQVLERAKQRFAVH